MRCSRGHEVQGVLPHFLTAVGPTRAPCCSSRFPWLLFCPEDCEACFAACTPTTVTLALAVNLILDPDTRNGLNPAGALFSPKLALICDPGFSNRWQSEAAAPCRSPDDYIK